MTSRAVPFILLVAAIGFLGASIVPAWAEDADTAALAAAMKNASATLQGGLKASEAQGTPISAKFEIEGRQTAIVDLYDEGQRLHGGCSGSQHRGDRQGGEDHGCGGFERSGRAEKLPWRRRKHPC